MGARALFEACCHPYFNELPRPQRGNHPRINFEGNNVDNDALHGLIDLLPQDMSQSDVADRWGIVVISKSGGTLETAAAFRILLGRLAESLGSHSAQLPELVVPVTGTSGKLFDLATELGCRDIFPVPDGVGGRFSVLSAVGLLPAAIMGLDIVKLLEGAVAMNDHFVPPRSARIWSSTTRASAISWRKSTAATSAFSRSGENASRPSACGTTNCSPRVWENASGEPCH